MRLAASLAILTLLAGCGADQESAARVSELQTKVELQYGQTVISR
jgi:hypothetical protein